MTLDEAIKHAEEKEAELIEQAEQLRDIGEALSNPKQPYNEPVKACHDCAEEHRQLAEWLKELKQLRNQTSWIPVSERLPDNETEVLFQYEYGQSMRVGYHIHDSTIYPFGYEDENETGWYDSEDNFICGSDEVIAWMPKPEPYQAESEEI